MHKYLICLVTLLMFAGCDKEDDKPKKSSFVYFLVTERTIENQESFILPLSKAEDIEAARSYIKNGEQKIVMATIAKNDSKNSSVNKDLINNRAWQWHVSEFLGFVDTSAEIYDGWPSYVDDYYDDWVANTKGNGKEGVIGFWNYAVSREVSEAELLGK